MDIYALEVETGFKADDVKHMFLSHWVTMLSQIL